jgi:DNA-binding NarL/FixJ family response regulator
MKTKNLTPEQIEKGFKYFCMGLNSKEIAKLLECSYRTIQNYMSGENWKEKRQNLNK